MKSFIFASLISGGLLFSFVTLSAAPQREKSEPPGSHLTIGRIIINRKNVFETGDTRDQRFPYSWANKIHIQTRESFIRHELLFQEGQPFQWERVLESERWLRKRPIFRSVEIIPQEPMNGVVDIYIQTQDVWTTTLQLAFGTAGGRTSYTLGVLEHNFLGTGKKVGAFIRQDIDRHLKGIRYKDPQLLGSRWEMSLGYGKDEKGREWETKLERPFFSVSVPHSEGMFVHKKDDEDRHFVNGQEVTTFQHESQDLRVFSAWAFHPSQTKVRRVTSAFERQSDIFSRIQGRPLSLPDHRVVSAVLLGYEFQNIEFHKVRGVRTFDRDEDINLGWEWMCEAGPSQTFWDASTNGAFGRFQVKKTMHPVESHVWFNHVDVEGRLEQGQVQNGTARLQSHYFIAPWRPGHIGSARFELTTSKNLDPERQFLLGGENGLRGYSVRQFSGLHKALLTLENRQNIILDWMHLVSIGWAGFIDSGAVWTRQNERGWDSVKSDIGVGLRLAPSRSYDPGLIRLDVAYALQDNNKSSRFIFNIGADLTFGERRKAKFEQ